MGHLLADSMQLITTRGLPAVIYQGACPPLLSRRSREIQPAARRVARSAESGMRLGEERACPPLLSRRRCKIQPAARRGDLPRGLPACPPLLSRRRCEIQPAAHRGDLIRNDSIATGVARRGHSTTPVFGSNKELQHEQLTRHQNQ